MTLINAVEAFDRKRQNKLPLEEKIEFISELDFKIFSELLKGRRDMSFKGYNSSTAENTALLAPEGFNDIYFYYLNMKLDLILGESARYNNSAVSFNLRYRELCDFISRTTPFNKKTKIKAGDIYV